MEERVIKLETNIINDEYTNICNKMFDVPISEVSTVYIKDNIETPKEWNIGLIYGESGSGKSTLLKKYGETKNHEWNKEKSIISCLNKVSPEKAAEILSAVGFSTIPAWLRPYHCLSNGQKFRADLARSIIEADDNSIILIDEFTSVIDRNVAKAASFAVQKYIRRDNKRIILASCHSDIIEWLMPDWIYNPMEAMTHAFPRGSLCKPQIILKIFRSKYEAWDLFKHNHYLSHNLNKSSKMYLTTWNENPIAITAILAFPHAIIKNAWRESRTVVLPDYQGLSIGTKISDYFGSLVRNNNGNNNGRYFSRTIHPAMVKYRLNHPEKWRVVLKGKVSPGGKNSQKHGQNWKYDARECYSFEYIGPIASNEESKLFWNKDL